ncbi:MAG TPA: FkbM family methyltransferase [Gemmatimonadaceae bacterium]|nr:FkbM family methyltransferase [Gemmatimonadaceae bacterium]
MSAWTPALSFVERLKYALEPREWRMRRMTRRHVRRGETELLHLSKFVPRDRMAIDVGANKGVFSYALSKLCPRVEAFEPNPAMFEALQHALSRNAHAHQIALSDTNGEAELNFPEVRGKAGVFSYQRATLLGPSASATHRALRVQTRTLDSFDFRGVGFIKIDVEGFEQAVLDGARATLARERPALMVELAESHTGRPIAESIAAIAARGYEVFVLAAGDLVPAASRSIGDRAFNFIAQPCE